MACPPSSASSNGFGEVCGLDFLDCHCSWSCEAGKARTLSPEWSAQVMLTTVAAALLPRSLESPLGKLGPLPSSAHHQAFFETYCVPGPEISGVAGAEILWWEGVGELGNGKASMSGRLGKWEMSVER